jgi:hypothetical protein
MPYASACTATIKRDTVGAQFTLRHKGDRFGEGQFEQ